MGSALLFHGPGACAAAKAEASRIGRLVAPPFGADGLRTDDAREIVNLMLSTPVGEELGVIVIGPIDEANPKAGDVLLKRLEEFNDIVVQPVLWAHDLGGVAPTIRSRCLERWVSGAKESEDEDEFVIQSAWALVDAALARDYGLLQETIKPLTGKKFTGCGRGLLLGIADALQTDFQDPHRRALWESVRPITRWKNPTMTEIVAALVSW